jgi:thiol-disulfide isomerase/thioredoxin
MNDVPMNELPINEVAPTKQSPKFLIGFVVLAVVSVGAIAIARRTSAQKIVTAAAPAAAAPATGSPAAAADPTKSVAAAPTSAAAKPAVTLPVLSPSAPDVVAPTGWINTPGLTPADLKGKVVLYEFWTFGCFNCKNVLPHVKAWHARYAKDGLITLSIHTPEFDYEGKVENIQKFVTENDITYPVALDPDRDIWHAFSNHYWPNMYLHDQQGQRRYEHIGEGSYDETEDAIRALLGVDPAAPRAEKV